MNFLKHSINRKIRHSFTKDKDYNHSQIWLSSTVLTGKNSIYPIFRGTPKYTGPVQRAPR